jgi:hypothetical protein
LGGEINDPVLLFLLDSRENVSGPPQPFARVMVNFTVILLGSKGCFAQLQEPLCFQPQKPKKWDGASLTLHLALQQN